MRDLQLVELDRKGRAERVILWRSAEVRAPGVGVLGGYGHGLVCWESCEVPPPFPAALEGPGSRRRVSYPRVAPCLLLAYVLLSHCLAPSYGSVRCQNWPHRRDARAEPATRGEA